MHHRRAGQPVFGKKQLPCLLRKRLAVQAEGNGGVQADPPDRTHSRRVGFHLHDGGRQRATGMAQSREQRIAVRPPAEGGRRCPSGTNEDQAGIQNSAARIQTEAARRPPDRCDRASGPFLGACGGQGQPQAVEHRRRLGSAGIDPPVLPHLADKAEFLEKTHDAPGRIGFQNRPHEIGSPFAVISGGRGGEVGQVAGLKP